MHRPRTVLGFDYGRARIGIAVGQELTASARPLATLKTGDWSGLDRLIREWQPDLLVVGVARHADGSPSPATTAALDFAAMLGQRCELPVHTIDERLSSREAERQLRATGGDPRRDKAAVDRLAAALILETWLQQERKP